MTIDLLENMSSAAPKGVRLLGMDIGRKTIGLALSDHDHAMVTPLQTIERTKFTKDMKILEEIVKSYEIGGFVIGLPLNVDGTEGPRCQSVRDFARELLNYPDIVGEKPWIALCDERFSTQVAQDIIELSVSLNKRKAKDRGVTDQLAAMAILERALLKIKIC